MKKAPATKRTREAKRLPAPSWAGPSIAIACLLLSIGLPEIVTRLLEPPLNEYRAIYFGGDPNSPKLFMTDPFLLWRLRPNVNLSFLDTRVSTDASGFRTNGAGRGQRLVVVMGDSTPFGWLVNDDQTFPARLQMSLDEKTSPARWRVVNAGVPGYSSFQVRRSAPALLRTLRPEVVVICVGNNEASPAAASDLAVAESRSWIAPFEAFSSASQFATWLKERLTPQAQFNPAQWDGVTRRVSVDEYADNVRAVITAAREYGARVILMSPPVNLFARPGGITRLPNAKQVEAWCIAIIARINAGDVDEALADIGARLAADPGAFYARWLRGLALTQAGQFEAGTGEMERAFADDPFADRAPSSYRSRLANLASFESVPFIDTNLLLRGPREAPLDQRFADHCHPDAAGNASIGAALVSLIPAD